MWGQQCNTRGRFVRQVGPPAADWSGRGQWITWHRGRDTLLIVFQPNLYSIVQPTTLSLASFLLPIMYSITQHCPIEVNARLQCSNFSRVIASLIAYNLVCFQTSSAHCGITCIGSLQAVLCNRIFKPQCKFWKKYQ